MSARNEILINILITDIMKNDNTLESSIRNLLEKHRQATFSSIERHMEEAYSEIASTVISTFPGSIPDRSVGSISVTTLKRICRNAMAGRDMLPDDHSERRKMVLEFINARSLSFETQRMKYPNYLKPWKEEDDIRLEKLWCEGVSERELARIFQRNLGAIRARAEKLQLEMKYGSRQEES